MTRYLSYSEVAARLGITTGGLGGAKLPSPDAIIGKTRGWLPETIDAWNATRPGRGNWRRPHEPDQAPEGANNVEAATVDGERTP